MTVPNPALTLAHQPAGTRSVVLAVKAAAQRTGADFDYLLKTAVRESSLKPTAKARTSSAAGLFQFIEQTWLATVKAHGPDFGLAREAAAIETGPDGRHKVPDRQMREAILALRHDPEVSALMAGALTRDSARALEAGIGRKPEAGELYIAHFLGASGAVKLINARESDPDVEAAALFPAAARANRAIFHDPDGRARTVGEVYDRLNRETALPEAAVAALGEAPRQMASAAARRPVVSTPLTPAAVQRHGGGSGGGAGGAGPIVLSLAGGAVPGARTPLVLTPAVVEVLASLDPLPALDEAGGTRDEDRHTARGKMRADAPVAPAAFIHERVAALRGTLA